ncbi:MAG TPA: tetratricopeptide repeat protein [Bacteroidia bacterium]|nr:tetratricopeptide repeat protein [Bacteroidia bacterium]
MQQILQMLESDPDDSFLHYALALELEKEGRTGEAITRIEALLDRDPEYTGAYYKLGQLYELTQQPEKAAACYTKGIVLTRQKGQDKAWRELKEALQNMED